MKRHTFKVICGFTMQYSFDEKDIGPDGEPTEEAVVALEAELEKYLHQNYAIELVDVETGFLLGISNDAAGS